MRTNHLLVIIKNLDDDEAGMLTNWLYADGADIIEPNPNEESIQIKPRDCTIYIDEIVIDTICIPEPASMAMLLGTSGLLAFIRRRFIS